MVGDAVTRRGRPKQINVEIVFMVGVAYEAADESKNYSLPRGAICAFYMRC
jgi:hypothetical protein